MSSRLPQLKASDDGGQIYVARTTRGHKIGFSRGRVENRVRACRGILLFVIQTNQRPCVLENVIHKHFAERRIFKREWFDLTEADLRWIRGLGQIVQGRRHNDGD
jgi:Meiotically up-regulated gene 113